MCNLLIKVFGTPLNAGDTPFRPPATPSGPTTPFHHAKPSTPGSTLRSV